MSGGYDSSLVTALLSRQQNINTFTIGFEDKKYNEAEYAKVVANYFGANHTEYYMTKNDLLNLIEDLPFYYDEPFGDSSALPTMILSRLAKKSVTVVLSADGGDESFVGYSKYFFLYKFRNIFSHRIKGVLLKVILNLLKESHIDFLNNLLPKKIRQTNIQDKYQ